MMGKTRSILLLLVLLAIGTGPVMAIDPGALQRSIKATVYVKVTYDFGLDLGTWASFGSGFFIDPAGYLLTNHHVIDDTVEIPMEEGPDLTIKAERRTVTVVLDSGGEQERERPATVLASDEERDLALLKVDLSPEVYLDTFSPSPVQLAMQVWAIGFPLGGLLSADRLEYSDAQSNPEVSLSSGMVASLRRDSNRELKLIQTDAALNPGNSGGPLVDAEGRLAGIISFGINKAEGLGFAVAPNRIQEFLQRHAVEIEIHPGVVTDPPEPIRVSVWPRFQSIEAAAGSVQLEAQGLPPVQVALQRGEAALEARAEVPVQAAGGPPASSYVATVTVLGASGQTEVVRRFRLKTVASLRAAAQPSQPTPVARPTPPAKAQSRASQPSSLADLARSVTIEQSVINDHVVQDTTGQAGAYRYYEHLSDEQDRKLAKQLDWMSSKIEELERRIRHLETVPLAHAQLAEHQEELTALQSQRRYTRDLLNDAWVCRCADGYWYKKAKAPCASCTVP